MDDDRTITEKTLFLAWQDTQHTRAWFPIGRLDIHSAPRQYRFRYTRGAEKAEREANFHPLFDFPEWGRVDESSELFPILRNRAISPGRKDFHDYLRMLDLPAAAEPAEILEVGGGNRATGNFEVFPKLDRNPDGSFRCRFFLHGSRHSNPAAIQRIDSLGPGENLYITIELTTRCQG